MITKLITGAGGMVGSHMVDYWHNKHERIVGTYYRPTTNLREIEGKADLIECDIRYPENIERIIRVYKPTQIYHLAAQSYPTVSWDKPYETVDINIKGTIAVFEAIKKLRKEITNYDPIVVVACSSAEYGAAFENESSGKIKEDISLKPLHPYGVSKVAQDLLSYQYWKNDQIRCIRARIFNTTGTRKTNDVVSDFTRRAVELKLEKKKTALRVGNLETRRAILDVHDLIEALVLLAEKGKPGEAYNIASEEIYQIQDIINIIELKMGIHYELYKDPSLLRSTDEKIISGDISKLKKDTGWQQKIKLEQTIAEMLQYWEHVL